MRTYSPAIFGGADRSSFSWRPARVVLVIAALALGTRFGVYGGGWLAITADSPSFVSIARDLRSGDLSDPRLGTVRLPGYPVFLAALDGGIGLSARLLLAAQGMLGVGAAVAGTLAGLMLGSRALALALGLTLSLHPALLVFEHSLMAETLAISLSAGFLAVLVAGLRTASLGLTGLAGALAGATLLTRLNLLPLILVAGVGAWLGIRWSAARSRGGGNIRWTSAFVAGLAIALVPWIVHLWRAEGVLAVFPGGEKLRLANAIELGLVSRERVLERLGPVAPAAVSPGSAYLKKLTLAPGTGESEARQVFRESLRADPWPFVRAAGVSGLAAAGWLPPEALGSGNELPAWLDEAEAARRGKPSLARQQVAQLLGVATLDAGRPPRFAALRAAKGGGLPAARGALLALACILVPVAANGGLRPEIRWMLAGLLSVEVLVAASFAASLAMRQRFAFPLDWVAVGLVAVAAADRLGRWGQPGSRAAVAAGGIRDEP
jgi:hypothetical protein